MFLLPKRFVSSNVETADLMRFWRLDDESDERRRRADVTIVGSGSLSHWATVWEFDGDVVRVAELTAWPVIDGGQPYEACNYLFYEIASVESLVQEKGYTRHEIPAIQVVTSPAELLRKCRDHPQNGTQYHAADNNCQHWVVELLCRGYGILPELLPPTWVDSAVVFEEQAAKAMITTAAAGVLGPLSRLGGGVGLFLSIVDAKFAIDELMQGTPPNKLCDVVTERIQRLNDIYLREPPGGARDDVTEVLEAQMKRMDNIRAEIMNHHTGFNVMRIGSNLMGVASGACLILTPFTVGVSGVIGVGLAIGSTVTFGSGQVVDSYFGYGLRSNILDVTENIVDARRRYASVTGRMADGLQGAPGVFEFSVPGFKLCQFYMTVVYTSHDGATLQRLSCDQGTGSWYGDYLVIEPGARNVRVSFDVRGGRQVNAVDRSQEKLPWMKPYRKEVFRYESGDGVRAHFRLAGTCSMDAHVYEVVESHLQTDW